MGQSPEIPLLGIHPKEIILKVSQNLHSIVYNSETRAAIQMSKIEDWAQKSWPVHRVEYYIVTFKMTEKNV